MRRLVLSGPHARLRARRWDVVVLGGALPGLVAAVRLAMDRLRVLLVEETAAAHLPAPLREPFFVPAASGAGVLDACLRELALPLIDRRRLTAGSIAYQVVLPEARVNVGPPALTAEELVAWGLAKPDEARELMRGLADAAAAERAELLGAPLVRGGGLRARARAVGRGRSQRHARGLPLAVSRPTSALAPFFGAQLRALVQGASAAASPEARARLLGVPLEAGAATGSADASLRALLRRRFASLHGEVRALAGRFELVHVDADAGLAPCDAGEVWLGRALVINAARAPLARWLREAGAEPPGFLAPRSRQGRRISIRLRARPEVVPEAMAPRVIRIGELGEPLEGTNVITVALFPVREREAQLVASTVVPAEEIEVRHIEQRLEEAVRALMPFADERLRRAETPPPPRWDDPGALEDPAAGGGWPGETDLRASTRPRVYRLPREEFGALGIEGECLLGWRGGDAIRADLG